MGQGTKWPAKLAPGASSVSTKKPYQLGFFSSLIAKKPQPKGRSFLDLSAKNTFSLFIKK
jgi:hypothetical protein